MKRKGPSLELIESEKQWARGKSANPTASREIAAHFLRAYRGRVELARAVSDGMGDSFSERLEIVRTLILGGAAPEAERNLGSPEGLNSYERAEFYLELARIRLLELEFTRAEAALDLALAEPDISEVTRLTCHQLAASSCIKQEQPERAVEKLKLALSIAEVFEASGSAFSSRAYLVQAYAQLGRLDEAEQEYTLLLAMLDRLDNDELWLDRRLTVLRAECQLSRLTQRYEGWRSAATEARELARWIGDQPCRAKCERELAEIIEAAGPPARPAAQSVDRFRGWVLLPRLKLLLHDTPREVVRIEGRPVAEKLILALVPGPLPKDQLFEKVWGIRFDSERHTAHLMAILSKVRKLLPTGSLILEDGMVELRR